MNPRQYTAERRAEAKIIQARNEAEASRIQSAARTEAEIAQINAEREMAQMRAESELARLTAELDAKRLQAGALVENPELLKVLQIEMVKGLATGGAKVVLGLDGDNIKSLVEV